MGKNKNQTKKKNKQTKNQMLFINLNVYKLHRLYYDKIIKEAHLTPFRCYLHVNI